jgi:hypothetical protein
VSGTDGEIVNPHVLPYAPDSQWRTDMSVAPQNKCIEVWCRLRTSPLYVHNWTVKCRVNEPNFLDYAWRDIGLDTI